MNIKIISAGAGSGKTYRLTTEMVDLLKRGVRANGIIATTFTRKAASELQERVRVRLLEAGMSRQAEELTNALIGTVHGLGVKLLQRFAFEAGVSPEVSIIADEDQQILFNQSLTTVLTEARVKTMDSLSDRLGLSEQSNFDWRSEVRRLTEVARANDFSEAALRRSSQLSVDHFRPFLGRRSDKSTEAYRQELERLLLDTIRKLEHNADETKTTKSALATLQQYRRELQLRGEFFWPQWAKLSKLKVGAKSREDAAPLIEFARSHDQHPRFHQDIQDFIEQVFDITIAAIQEYDAYKKRRGLIDYTDMEVLIKRLLDQPLVRRVLSEELDLLMVDEFQDTSPLQLEIFLKLSGLANYSVWVGDPKQSIYGFRGADPELMQAIIDQTGGVKPEDIQEYSWRSREDIVNAANALFTHAFSQLPPEQVALKAKRTKFPQEHSLNRSPEPLEMDTALIHWHFRYELENKKQPGKPWTENCIAEQLREWLAEGRQILPKGEKQYRKARPGDVAILCRSNKGCQEMAEALNRAGLRVAISREGLLGAAEAKLVLACLKYLLNRRDSLSVAEILRLAAGWPTEKIIEHRLAHLAKSGGAPWAAENEIIRYLDAIRDQIVDFSSAETLNLLLGELDIRRMVAAWGNVQQRLDNIDLLRKLALQYEEACNRLHTAASLGGLLLYLNELERGKQDFQGAGEGPDAVNVLTYHKSKGLEWPVVICHSLEGQLRAEVWGVDLIPESPEVDLDNILGNRWLRYWVNPYGRQYQYTPVAERLEDSQVKQVKKQKALQEEARLLYVGVTRARDYLILPSTAHPTRWLNRVWHGQEDQPTLDPYAHESPWEWNGQVLPMDSGTYLRPRDFTVADPPDETVRFIEPQYGERTHEPLEIDLRRGSTEGFCMLQMGNWQYYGMAARPLPENEDPYAYAKALKALLTAYHPDYSRQELMTISEGLSRRYEIEEAENLLERAEHFYNWVDAQFTYQQMHRKLPIRHIRGAKLFSAVLDLVLESPSRLTLIQHSGFAGGEKECRNKVRQLANWLHLSKEALEQLYPGKPVRSFVHFVLSTRLIEVVTQGSAPPQNAPKTQNRGSVEPS